MDRTPQPPAHGLGTFDDRPSDRVLSTPVGGHYTDNPYNRYSTTWDPVLSSTQVQVDGTPDTYVQSDDEDETYRRGQAAGAAGAAAASGGALAALGARVGRPAPSQSYNGGGTGSGYDRGGLLGGSDVSSGNINNGRLMFRPIPPRNKQHETLGADGDSPRGREGSTVRMAQVAK